MLSTLLGHNVPPPDVPWDESVKIAFYIGSFPVPWYAIFIMLGFILAIVGGCIKMWKRYNINVEPFYWFILIGVPIAIIGANFGSCVLGEPAGKPWSEFWSSFGKGLAIEWGVIFTFIAACIYFPLVLKLPRYRIRDSLGATPQVKRISMWMYTDAIMCCILFAQFLGRWGNYFNQEVYGAVVTDPNLAQFLHDCLPWMWVSSVGDYCQPLFLWEGLGNLAMFFILYFGVEFIRGRKAGDMTAAYFLWYGAFRTALEPLRNPNYYSPVNMAVSIIFIVYGALFIIINHTITSRARRVFILRMLMSYPRDFFKMIASSYKRNKEQVTQNFNEQYSTEKYKNCLRQPQEMIYFGRW